VLPLIERKAMLKKLLRRKRSRILYLDHVDTAAGGGRRRRPQEAADLRQRFRAREGHTALVARRQPVSRD